MTRARHERGFTLIELLIAFAILAVSLAAIFRVFSSGLESTSLARSYGEAAATADSLLATVGVDPAMPTEIGRLEGRVGAAYDWVLDISDVAAPESDRGGDPLVAAYHVVLSLQWGDNGKDRSIELEKIVLKAPNE